MFRASNISRAHYVEGEAHSYRFGIDRIGGLFLQIFEADGTPGTNFTQIQPFDKRFVAKEVEKAIPPHDLALIRSQETPAVDVFFEVGVNDDYDENATSPILLRHIEEAVPFECRTFGDLLDAHKHFAAGEFIEIVSFVDDSGEILELRSDEVEWL